MRQTTRALLALFVVGCGSSAPARFVGPLESNGGELGAWTFTPDACVNVTADTFDLTDASQPALTVRLGGWPDPTVVVANRAAAGGPAEMAFAEAADCHIVRAVHVMPGLEGPDIGLGFRIDCATPSGARLAGVVAAGVCR